MALCATTALAGAVSRLCVRGARGRFGGGSGRYLVLCLSCFPLPAPRVPRCVCRAVPSGRPLPSLAGTPFHAVCAFRALGPVALPVVPACPFRVCALALSRFPLPPPLGGVARASRVVPALGAGRAVPLGACPSACPAPVPCSVWRAWGGAVRSRFPPPWLGVAGAAAPGRPSSGAGSLGSASRVSWVRSVQACVPSTGPPACALAGRRCSLWGWWKGVPGGGAFHRCEGRLVSGAVPPPAARPLERAATVPRPVCPGCGRCGRVDPAPAPQRAPLRAGVARCGGGGRASPGGGLFRRCEGRLVSGAVPPPAARPLERAARVPQPVCPGCGRCGRVDPAPAPQRAPLRAGVARCGGGGRASPEGVPSTVVRGAWCQALSLSRPPVLWSGQPGFRDPCVPGAVDAGVWTLHRPHSVRPCGPALLAVGVAEGRPRGGVSSAVVRGAWCQALSLPRPPVLWSGQPGFRYPCVPGAVGAGVWTLHRPHSVRPCGPALLAVGVAEGRPRGGFLPPLCGAPGGAGGAALGGPP